MEITAGTVSLWWDMESCPLPPPFDPCIVNSLAPALLRKFNIIDVKAGGIGCSQYQFFAYELFSQTQTELDQTFIKSGIGLQRLGLQRLPPGMTSNDIEKMMMADVYLWAMDSPPPANIIFIVGHVDRCSLFQNLRERSHNVFLVCPSINQMPQGMLKAANDCLEWISFLRSLQDEVRQPNKQKNPVSLPGGVNPNPNPKFKINAETNPAPKQKASSEEFAEFFYKLLSAGEFSQGFELGRLRPKFEEQTGKILDAKHLGYKKLSELVAAYNHFVSVDNSGTLFSRFSPQRPAYATGKENPNGSPSPIGATEKKNPNRSPSPIVATGRKEKSESLEKFKAWLVRVVNSKEYAENGYNISQIRLDFQKATGRTLDEMSLGFSKIIDLVEECRDAAVIKEVYKGCHMAFPVKQNKQNNPVSSSGGVNPNQSSKINTKAEKDPKLKPIASADDFSHFLYQMLLAGQFSKGFMMSLLPQKFEEQTGKLLDVQHLGYSQLSKLVASYSYVSVNKAGTKISSTFPQCHASFTEKKKTPNRNPSPSVRTGPEKNSGSLERFKAWLAGVVNSKEYAKNGYNISCIYMDFKEATGKTLNEMSLGFSRVIDLVEECKDVAVLKEIHQGCHLAFPVKPSKQKNPVSSAGGMNPNPTPKIKPKATTDPIEKPIASADDFRDFIYQMLAVGEFSKGFPMSQLPRKFEEKTGKFLDVKHLGYNKLSKLIVSYNHLVSVNNAGTEISPMIPKQPASSTEKKNPKRNPSPSVTTGSQKKPGSLKKFKAWLGQVVNSKEHAENGYNISGIRVDYKEATGKTLDEMSLGFSRIIDLVEECKDVAVLKEVIKGCHLAFPVKSNKQEIPGASADGLNLNPSKNLKSIYKPKAETNPKLKQKASAKDFREFLYHMLLAGDFSQGFLMSLLHQRFEDHTEKILDVEHLGYKKLSELVASYTDLVSVDNAGPGSIRIFPAGFVKEAVPSNPISNTSKVTSMNTDYDPSKMKEKVEADCFSSGVSGNEILQNRAFEENNYNKQFPYMNSESERLSAITTGSQTSVSSSPVEANNRAFRECDIKSDSSSTPEGSQVSEWEGRSSTTISDTTSFHGEGSSFINLILALQRDGNIPIGDLTIAKHLIAQAIQSRTQRTENINFFGEPRRPVDTGLTDSFSQPSESPSLEPQVGCNSPCPPLKSWAESSVVCAEDLRDGKRLDCKPKEQNTESPGKPRAGYSGLCASLQSRAESSALCAEDSSDGIRLDCIKENEQSTTSAGNEERSTSMSSAVSSAGSIIQLAGRGLKSICELTTWRNN